MPMQIKNASRVQATLLAGLKREHATTLKMREEFTANIKHRELRASELRGIAKYLEVRSRMYDGVYRETATRLAAKGYNQLSQELSATLAEMAEQQRAYTEKANSLASE